MNKIITYVVHIAKSKHLACQIDHEQFTYGNAVKHDLVSWQKRYSATISLDCFLLFNLFDCFSQKVKFSFCFLWKIKWCVYQKNVFLFHSASQSLSTMHCPRFKEYLWWLTNFKGVLLLFQPTSRIMGKGNMSHDLDDPLLRYYPQQLDASLVHFETYL